MGNAPFMYWVGVDMAEGTTPAQEQEFNEFYSNVHMHEVVERNPGFIRATRYVLHEPDPRGDFGPQYLATYEMEDEEAAKGYIARNDGPPEGKIKYTQGPAPFRDKVGRWRLLWRRIHPDDGSLGESGAPYISIIGVNAPEGATEQELKAFNDFWNDPHMPEVIKTSGFLRGMRYDLYRGFRHPDPTPHFLAAYDADDNSLKTRAEMMKRNPDWRHTVLSEGPPVWEAHTTPWRLLYRRIDGFEKPR